jgi:hypothetical protein
MQTTYSLIPSHGTTESTGPGIVEAAIAIFSGMEVREIAHAHADAHNLTLTVDTIFDALRDAKRERRKLICFLTGVPGSGKSLAGLRAVHDPRIGNQLGTDPNFLSGNGPLVKILREALVRDFASREQKSRAEARRKVETLIQNVHVFAKFYMDESPGTEPYEKVIVFDEAQRAWSAEKNQRKFDRGISEPAMILQIMDRHPEWAALIALAGRTCPFLLEANRYAPKLRRPLSRRAVSVSSKPLGSRVGSEASPRGTCTCPVLLTSDD